MKKLLFIGLVLVFAAGGYVAGRLRGQSAAPASEATAREILYYVDPMNPANTSDRPGFAPCGMKMEPVYADSAPASPAGISLENLAEGAVKISPERQQLAGIHVASVEKKGLPYSLRLPGRIAVDEARLYRIHAAANGWISRTLPSSTGSLVKKDETLAELNSPELLPAVQSLLFTLNSRSQRAKRQEPDEAPSDSVFKTDLTYLQGLSALRHLGMGQRQLDELVQTRKFVQTISITSPVDGVLMARNVSDDSHVEKGHELFRIADLSRVWILADVSGWEGEYLKPGTQVRVSAPRQTRTFTASVSQALPLVDNDSRTLKVRLELDNPAYALRPDMFVDLELVIELPEMMVVDADAVLDSGLRQTVFADLGGGFFEPREVKTGRHFGTLVEILDGLAPGEKIVTAGNFLLDSESRMKQAAASSRGSGGKDPVCGMKVDEPELRAAGQFSVYLGRTYYFCNPACKRTFDADPAEALMKARPASMQTADAASAIKHANHRP